MQAAGIALALVLLLLLAAGLWWIWQVPFRALGLLVAGMALHNFVLMLLLRLETPHLLVRAVQSWKEIILVLLALLAARLALRRPRSALRPALNRLDLVAAAFVALALLYLVIPGHLLGNQANLSQRLVGLRLVLLLPALYAVGRIFPPPNRRELALAGGVILGAGAIVGLFGLFELWLIPTRAWLDWGVNQLSAWLGFHYAGPRGLPENFFQTASEGLLLRRMVSTYVSPLGIAYTGLLVIPIGTALVIAARRSRPLVVWLGGIGLVLLLTGVFFSVTRLALAAGLVELGILMALFRRPWLIAATGLAVLGTAFMLFQYTNVGPVVQRDLSTVAQRPAQLHIVSGQDPSLREHGQQLTFDIKYALHHPLGTGLGSSVHRFGASQGTGESAIFDMFGDLGVIGGLLYLGSYSSSVVIGFLAYRQRRRDALASMLPLVALVGGIGLLPITLTSDVWGDLSVTFLFWWAAGSSVTLWRAGSTSEAIV